MAATAGEYSIIPIDRLRVGVILRAPIFDEGSPAHLIASGQQLTTALLEQLAQRGIIRVRVDNQDYDRVSGERVARRSVTRCGSRPARIALETSRRIR